MGTTTATAIFPCELRLPELLLSLEIRPALAPLDVDEAPVPVAVPALEYVDVTVTTTVWPLLLVLVLSKVVSEVEVVEVGGLAVVEVAAVLVGGALVVSDEVLLGCVSEVEVMDETDVIVDVGAAELLVAGSELVVDCCSEVELALLMEETVLTGSVVLAAAGLEVDSAAEETATGVVLVLVSLAELRLVAESVSRLDVEVGSAFVPSPVLEVLVLADMVICLAT